MVAHDVEQQVSPLYNVLALLKGYKSYSRGYTAHCPGPKHRNGDKRPSLVIWEDEADGHVGLQCHAGCTRKEIVEALGITESDLYRHDTTYKRQPARKVLDVCDLMVDKIIHPSLLQQWEIHDGTAEECTFYKDDGTPYVAKGVVIPYFNADGTLYERYRVRTSLKKPIWNGWNEKTQGKAPPAILYGLNYLEVARKRGYLVIVEGESDWWTLRQHDFPVLALPGATHYKCIKLDYLKDIERVFILQESDEAGRQLPANLYKHLKSIGYSGKVYAVDLNERTKCKDPNELQKKIVKDYNSLARFKPAFQEALDNARPFFSVGPDTPIARLCDLQGEVLPETRWAIPDILPEGLILLVGKPKLGKSWLLLALLIGIANGGVVLGNVPVEAGEVLYISLEDNKKRLQRRTNKVAPEGKVSDRFYYATDWPRLNEGGMEKLEDFIAAHPNLKVIGIDTWARIKPRMTGRQQQYDEDYDTLTPLQQLAAIHEITIVVVHHMRKQESDDPLDMISGSTAMQGAVDGFLLLYRKRGETDARLYIDGRDIEETEELELSFSKECATWTLKGDAEENAGTPERQAIYDLLKQCPKGLTLKEIADKLEKNRYTVRNLLVRLRNSGKVFLQNNIYCVVTHSTHSTRGSQRSQSLENSPSIDQPVEPMEDRLDTLPTTTTTVTTPDYATVVTRSNPTTQDKEPDHKTHNCKVTTATTQTTTKEQIDYEVALSLCRRLFETALKDERQIDWDVPGSQFEPGVITFSTYKYRMKKCIDAGGDRLAAVIPEIRHKVAAYEGISAL